MTLGRLLLRSLVHYKAMHCAVALGVAVGAAVLTGALLVGDSVRGSLRDLTLDRLGGIDHALVADRYVRQALADEIGAAPAVLIRASIEAADSGARASKVTLHGVDEGFWQFYDEVHAPELGPRDIALNASLAVQLGVGRGDAVLARFQTDTLVPSESMMGRKSDNVRTLRLTVGEVLPDRGPGRFGLSPSQQLPLNAFVSLAALQRALGRPGRINALFASGPDPNASLGAALTLEDLELSLDQLDDPPGLSLNTGRIVLEQAVAKASEQAAMEAGLGAAEVLTYLANSMRIGERNLPYSTVTALGGPTPLLLDDETPAPELSGDQLYLNDWAARDLQAVVGDPITMSYYVVAPGGALDIETAQFEVAGVVRLQGLAADASLAPRYEGMSDVERMGDWDPAFPIDLGAIRPVDEDYWERYRTAPKAFVALDRAKQLWTSRFGQLTSIRFTTDDPLDEAGRQLRSALRAHLDPAAFGLAFQPVKQQGLEASAGATDFSGLFIGFSMFLIAAAAMLVTLLFRLGVERRAQQIGLLFAAGKPASLVHKLLLGEGALAAAAGCLLGVPLAVGYGALMVHGLRTWWSAAVGGSFLELHVTATTLAAGVAGSFLLMMLSIWLSARKLSKLSPHELLSGSASPSGEADRRRRARRPRTLAAAAAVLALALLVATFTSDALPREAAFFGIGALALISGLAAFRAVLFSSRRTTIDPAAGAAVVRLGVRNIARFPTRSVLSAALVACATFVIVAVAVNRRDVTVQEPTFDSGDGGFRLIADSDLALQGGELREAGPDIFPLRVALGEDASCLNLYRPSEPTLLGTPAALVKRGGFAFQSTLAETPEERENPWLLLDKQFLDGAVPVFGDANSVLWILHLGLGKTLEVEDGQGRPQTLLIAGLLSRSIFQSELLLSEERFLQMRPGHSGYNAFLIETDDLERGAELEQRWGDQGFDAVRTADRLAGYLVVENTYLSTFQTLGGLGLLLGTLGLAVVMVRNVIERRGELALLQAVGFGRRSISRLVLAENGALLVFGVLAGTAAALLATTPHLLSAMARPPWWALVATLAAILAVGLLTGALAVRRSLEQPLLPGLRRE